VRPLNSAVPGALATLLHKAPLSAGKVTFAWRTAVGAAMDRVTSVRLDGHTLVVEAADRHWAREVSRSSTIVLARLQHLLGRETVTGLTVRVKPS
jgi:predicted nucleic acid-binding Zn ribbon protein